MPRTLPLTDLLARARRLEVNARHLARSHFAGLYRSAFRGQGIEFAEVREYAEGDDVRLIDWNVSARTGSLYVKRMTEERERHVLLAIDTSASLAFGSVRRTKFELVQEIAALLALACGYSRDRVGLALFRSRVEYFIAAGKGWAHAERLIRELAAAMPAGPAGDFDQVWAFLNSPGVPRSLVFLLTDFQAALEPTNSFAAACRKHEMVFLLVSDPREWSLPPVGRICVMDPESGHARVLRTGARERGEYATRAQQRRTALLKCLRGSGADFAEFSTGQEYDLDLRRFLGARSTRTRPAAAGL